MPIKRSFKEQFVRAKELAGQYDLVIWLLDLDVLIKEKKEGKGMNPFMELQRVFGDVKKNHDNLQILINTPCLEFWYLIHFQESGKFYQKCSDVTRVLQAHLPKCEKSKKYYLHSSPDLFAQLKSKLPTARKRARNLGEFDIDNPERAMAQIFKVYDILGI